MLLTSWKNVDPFGSFNTTYHCNICMHNQNGIFGPVKEAQIHWTLSRVWSNVFKHLWGKIHVIKSPLAQARALTAVHLTCVVVKHPVCRAVFVLCLLSNFQYVEVWIAQTTNSCLSPYLSKLGCFQSLQILEIHSKDPMQALKNIFDTGFPMFSLNLEMKVLKSILQSTIFSIVEIGLLFCVCLFEFF